MGTLSQVFAPEPVAVGGAKSVGRTCMESALRILYHARNSHGSLRPRIRELVHVDVKLLRGEL